jgi:UDP-N-acetylglucosamine--N-acetylmuramyl-(pentapeptide) pyrophosphoryl-undecaprenol N-acetylglucosamine transferase
MRLALTAGGTGGHVMPALAVMEAVRARNPGVEVRFFGPEDRGERKMVEGRGVGFVPVPSAAVRGRGPLRLARSAWRIAAGVAVATRQLRKYRPDVVFSTGGYASFPCSVAARILRRPLVLYLPDVTPGWAVRAEQRLATRLATTTEAALAHLPRRKTTVTGYPVRAAFFARTREQARAALGVAPGERVLLVAGASQGARAINAAVFAALRPLVAEATVFHVTGADEYDEAAGLESRLGGELAKRYRPAAFRDDLPDVMLAADLAVMRAGASTLGELTAAALPAILVPGTYAGGHQRHNAEWLVQHGAAVLLEERELGSFAERVLELLGDDARRATMRKAAASLARPDAADRIAAIVCEVATR